jgi:hypothetical protein
MFAAPQKVPFLKYDAEAGLGLANEQLRRFMI